MRGESPLAFTAVGVECANIMVTYIILAKQKICNVISANFAA